MIDKKILSILKENGWNLNIPEITDDMKKNKELILKAIENDYLRDQGSNIENVDN